VVAEYKPRPVPEHWDPAYIWEELQAVADAIITRLELDPDRVPGKPRIGMLNYFDVAGDPGNGRGYYGYTNNAAYGEQWEKFATWNTNNFFEKAQYVDNADGQAALVVTATDFTTETGSVAALGYNATMQIRAMTAYTPASASYLIEWRSTVATKGSKVRQLNAQTQAEIETYLETWDGGDICLGSDSLATGSTDGFVFIPAVAGTPTGTPNSRTGFVPVCYDTTNNELYVYNSGWKSVALA
jgi:hypothetical protein